MRPESVCSRIRPAIAASLALLAVATGARAQEFLIDFGPQSLISGVATTPSPDANGNTWNNMTPGVSVRLRDTAGALSAGASAAGILLEATTSFGTSLFDGEGLPAPDAGTLGTLAVASATGDYAFRLSNAGTDVRFRLREIDPAASLTFELLGSRSGGGTPSETRYTVTGADGAQTIAINTANNAGALAAFSGVRPNGNGEILVRLEADEGVFMYLNAARLRVETEGPQVTFTQQPEAAIADGGGTLVFTATVTASEPGLTLRWERDGEPLEDDARISGARTDTLVIDRAGIDDVGEYRLAATLGTTTVRSTIAAGVVRATLLGPIDANGDGVLDFHDMIRFLRSYDEVSP